MYQQKGRGKGLHFGFKSCTEDGHGRWLGNAPTSWLTAHRKAGDVNNQGLQKKGTDSVVSTEEPSGCLAACNSWDQQGGNCRYCHTALIVNEHIQRLNHLAMEADVSLDSEPTGTALVSHSPSPSLVRRIALWMLSSRAGVSFLSSPPLHAQGGFMHCGTCRSRGACLDHCACSAPCFGSPTVVLGGGLLIWSDAEDILGLFHLCLSSVGRLLKRKCEALISISPLKKS